MLTLDLLLAAPEIANYPDLFPRLQPRHPEHFATAEMPPTLLQNLVTRAGRVGPLPPTAIAESYRRMGELDSLQVVAPEQLTPATAEWERIVNGRLTFAEERARLCDRERVPTHDGGTWQRMLSDLRDLVKSTYAGSPGLVVQRLDRYQEQMQAALTAAKERLRERLRRLRFDLGQRKESLDTDAYDSADKLAERIHGHINADDLFLAVQRLDELAALLEGQSATSNERSSRLPLPVRVNPSPRESFHFEELVLAAKGGNGVVQHRGLQRYLPTRDAIAQACDEAEFLALHASRRVPDRDAYVAYFAALVRWLGLGLGQEASRGRLKRLNMTNLEPKGKLPGRWHFLATEPWQGAPYYEDPEGRPRLLAIVRLGIADSDRNNQRTVATFITQTLKELFGGTAESEDERRFKQEGLVLVLVPGNLLSARPYQQFQRDMRLDKAWRSDRIAYLDDLDLLRVLPVNPEQRFRAFLELALPRFSAALSVTYQNSDAVRPRMFYGRQDEILRLENGATVVFSGRRMGKSSLLRRLQSQCGPESAQRAVMVGCSAIGVGRSWQILTEIERELAALVRREPNATLVPPPVWSAAPTTDAAADMERAKNHFRDFLEKIMAFFESVGVRLIYILLDEADNFIRAEMEENSGRKNPRATVAWFLKDLQTIGSYMGKLRFIFAGYDQVGRIYRDPSLGDSAFGHWGSTQSLNLGPLDEDAARALVIEPLSGLGMPVSRDMADRILDYTSRHASLIQVFGKRLADYVKDKEPDWPLNDVPIKFEHLIRIADDERGDDNFRQQLERTLGLNLDIARAYPLRFVFLALVTPGGLGQGRILGAEPFPATTALEQLRRPMAENDWPDLPDALVTDSLELLVQLGLLEEARTLDGRYERAYRFRAWHYVTVLRTRNGLRNELRQAAKDWADGSRRLAAEPRCVWTLPDPELHALRRLTPQGPAVLVGLPHSGRDYAMEMLGSPLADGAPVPCFRLGKHPEAHAQLTAWLAEEQPGLAVVADPDDVLPWDEISQFLHTAALRGRSLRWVGGPKLAWELAGDYDLCVELQAVHGLGTLTAAEMEPWTARSLGTTNTGSGATVPLHEADAILRHTGAILPVLELFREWLLNKKGSIPDPLTARSAQEYLQQLKTTASLLERAVRYLKENVPDALRVGLHHLFRGAADYDFDAENARELMEASEYLKTQGMDYTNRILDVGRWLGFVTDVEGRLRVPHASALGLIVQQASFISPP